MLLGNYSRLWGLPLLGLALFVIGLGHYESYESKAVLGRWSYSFFALLSAAATLWLVVFVWSVRRTASGTAPALKPVHTLLGSALFAYGTAHLVCGVVDPTAEARILALNVFGSVQPVAALLELVALALGLIAGIIFCIQRVPKRWQNLGVTAITTLLLLLVGEAIARVKAIAHPVSQGFPTYSSALWNRRYVEVNHLGFRDGEYAIPKPVGVRRVLVVGDSYTFGIGVDDTKDRLAESIAAKLADATSERWEPISGGRPDTDTLDHIEFLHRLARLEPDVVVLAYVFNDIDYLAAITERGSITDPQGVLQRYLPGRVLFLNSYLYQEIFVRVRLVRLSLQETAPPNPYMDDELLTRHVRDVATFVDYARSIAGTVVVVPYDNTINAAPGRADQYRRFVENAREQGLPVCDLSATFNGRDVASLRVNALDAHPNGEANRLAAASAVGCILAE